MASKKRLGVLTSGGDCAGLNAVIRAVVLRAETGYGWDVVGINEGPRGLMERPVDSRQFAASDFVDGVLRDGGTILGTTSSGDPFDFPMPDGSRQDRSDEIIEGYRKLGLDALIAIGGDGSLAILRKLAQKGGLNLVAIPKTIDNDVVLTENSVGYLTAVDICTEALDRLQPTAASHNRVMVLEVMGRANGHVALGAGIAGGADVILIPGIPWSIDSVSEHVRTICAEEDRHFALVIVAEGVPREDGKPVDSEMPDGKIVLGGIGHYLGQRIAEETGAETRVTVLGHTQRGAAPIPRDRYFASAFGVHAVDPVACLAMSGLGKTSNINSSKDTEDI